MKRNPEDQAAPKGPPEPTNTTPFGPPVVSPQVTDPAALRYAAGLDQRKPAKYRTPVAGGPTPPIPRLDQPASEAGLTMADHANVQRAQEEAPVPAGPPVPPPRGGMFQAGGPAMATPSISSLSGGGSGPPPGILPSDILPAEAREDPDFKEGAGSMYASSQPNLAYKYGIIRKGQRMAPQSMGQAQKGLSDKTIEGLKAVQDAQALRQKIDSGAHDAERDSAASSAGAAGRLGNAPSDGPQADPTASQKNLVDAVKKLDDFDFNTFREMMMKDIINNTEQQQIIEARCAPLDIGDLIMRGYVTQRVPILPNKFEPEFRSMTGSEDLAIKRLVMKESKGLEVSDRYLLDKFSLMAVTIGLSAINGNAFPDHRDSAGRFDEDKFWEKFNFVTNYPFHMLASLGVNYFWFDIRVRKLFVAEKLGNG